MLPLKICPQSQTSKGHNGKCFLKLSIQSEGSCRIHIPIKDYFSFPCTWCFPILSSCHQSPRPIMRRGHTQDSSPFRDTSTATNTTRNIIKSKAIFLHLAIYISTSTSDPHNFLHYTIRCNNPGNTSRPLRHTIASRNRSQFLPSCDDHVQSFSANLKSSSGYRYLTCCGIKGITAWFDLGVPVPQSSQLVVIGLIRSCGWPHPLWLSIFLLLPQVYA